MGIAHSQIVGGRCRKLRGNGKRSKVPLRQVRPQCSQLSIDNLLRSGYRIRDEEEIRDGETYYLTAGEQFEMWEIRVDNESVVLHFPNAHTFRFDGDFDTAHSPRNHSRQSYQYNKAPKNGYIPPSRKNSLRRESRVSISQISIDLPYSSTVLSVR